MTADEPLTADARDVRDEILRRQRNQSFAIATLCIILGILMVFVLYEAFRLKKESDRTTHALCTLRNDLKSRVVASEEFLLAHPKGISDIPAASIRTSIAGQKQTITALHVLNCDP